MAHWNEIRDAYLVELMRGTKFLPKQFVDRFEQSGDILSEEADHPMWCLLTLLVFRRVYGFADNVVVDLLWRLGLCRFSRRRWRSR
jgi:hypothetical protein